MKSEHIKLVIVKGTTIRKINRAQRGISSIELPFTGLARVVRPPVKARPEDHFAAELLCNFTPDLID
jgi:hypothetical protein